MPDEKIEERPPFGTGEDRALGAKPTGSVNLRSFDEGVVVTLGGVVVNDNYVIPLSKLYSVQSAPGDESGVPIVFAFPDDNYEHWRFPCIVVRRDDIAPAMSRWHPGTVVYRGPAQGAVPLAATFPTGNGTSRVVQGWDRYEQQQQAIPYDLTYTISILARYRGFGNTQPIGQPVRGAASPVTQANRLLTHCLQLFQPYGSVFVRDSSDEWRTYEAFLEAISHLDQVGEVADRMIGFALTLRVEAELDLNDPVTYHAVTGTPALSVEGTE